MSSKKIINKSTQSNREPRTQKSKRSRRNGRSKGKSLGPDGILAGYGSSITSVFSSRATSDGQIVRGYDLLPIFTLGSNISFYLPSNPTSWNGTRIAAIASGYQSYRPLSFKIHYRPQTGSNSSVAVFIGTLWQTNYITGRSQLEPSLLTSPGGVYTPAWQSCVSTVHCGTYLPQRMFPTRDPHTTTVPFAIVARSTDSSAGFPSVEFPGRLFVEYTYEFRNAIGSGSGYSPSQIKTVSISGGIYTGINPPTGILVDLDEEFSNNFPLGAIVEWSVNPGQTNQHQIMVNGQQINPAGSRTLFIYLDGAFPA